MLDLDSPPQRYVLTPACRPHFANFTLFASAHSVLREPDKVIKDSRMTYSRTTFATTMRKLARRLRAVTLKCARIYAHSHHIYLHEVPHSRVTTNDRYSKHVGSSDLERP